MSAMIQELSSLPLYSCRRRSEKSSVSLAWMTVSPANRPEAIEVRAFAVDRVRQHRRVATDQIAGAVNLRNASIPALGDEVRQVLDGLGASQQRFDAGVILEVLHEVIGAAERVVELAQQRAASHRQGVLVRVDEHEAGHAHGRVAEALDR